MQALQESLQESMVPDPLSGEYGSYKTAKARFWSWRSDEIPYHLQVVPSLLSGGAATRPLEKSEGERELTLTHTLSHSHT